MSLPKGILKKSNDVDIRKTPFVIFQAHKDDFDNISSGSSENVNKKSILSEVFFHPKNIDLIQQKIIREVFRRSKGEYLIEKQNDRDLEIVMKYIFQQHAKHLPDHIKEQVYELNCLVVDEVLPDIISQLKAYFGYLKSAFGPRQIMDLPKNVSITGTKTLPSVTNLFGR